MRRVLLDTDLGGPTGGVDDALALAVLLGSLEVELVGVVVTNGCPARVRSLLAAAGRASVSVEAGVDPVARRVLADPGGIDLLCIGPMSTLAEVLEAAPEVATAVRSVTAMGGRFVPPEPEERAGPWSGPETNWETDPQAVATVLASGCPLLAAGLEVTTRLTVGEDEAAALEQAGALGALLAGELRTYLAETGRERTPAHDALAALTIVAPACVTTTGATLSVTDDGTATAEDRGEPPYDHAVVMDVDAAAARREMRTRLLRATNASGLDRP